MWNWIITNSVWMLVITAIILILLIVAREKIERTEAKKTKKQVDTKHTLVRILNIFGTVVIAVAMLSVVGIILSREGVSGNVTPETIEQWILDHGITILVIVVAFYAFHRFIKLILPELVEQSVKARGRGRQAKEEMAKRTQTLNKLLLNITAALLVIIAAFMILTEMNVNITPLLASAGIVGIAIGLGAQSLITDVINGLFILMEDQFNKGDVVKIASISGQVEEVNLRRTILRDLDGIVHSIPNGEIKTSSNYTKEWSRVNLDVPVAYGEDLDRVIEVINRVGMELAEDKIFSSKIKTPPQVLRVNNFGDSGIDIKILGDTKPLMQWEVTGELRKRLKKAFDQEGIEIPWPHVKLYFGQTGEQGINQCPHCSSPNLPGSLYCAQCGTMLHPALTPEHQPDFMPDSNEGEEQ